MTFESVPAPVGDALPRMDIAAFVGFASSGPLDTPVVVEDVARFRDIFGADVSLGQIPDTAEIQSGHLGPTVEAFFRNGGRRCWIVRVAGNAASANRFPLDGWIGMDPVTGEWRLRQAIARSGGTWSDALRIGTALGAAPISAPLDHDWADRTILFASDVDLQAGDMVRLSFGAGDLWALLAVSAVNRQAGRLTVDWQEALVLQRPSPMTPPPNPLRAAVVTAEGEEALAHLPVLAIRGEPGEVLLTLPEDSAPPPQTLLRFDLDDGSTLVVRAGDVVGASTIDSPPAGTADLRLLEVSAHDGWLVSSDLSVVEDPSLAAPVAERLAMTVLVWQGERLLSRLDDVAPGTGHARSWSDLPTDEVLFRTISNLPDGESAGTGVTGPGLSIPAFWEEVSGPRFPLAALAGEGSNPWWPLAVSYTPAAALALSASTDTSSSTRLVRNGLDSFSESLFLDPDLSRATTTELLPRAHSKSYVGPTFEPLTGFHSLLPIEEVTLVAVPDACHPGWEERLGERDDPPAAPHLWPLEEFDASWAATWSAVHDATSYTLEWATTPDFADAAAIYRGSGETPSFSVPTSPPHDTRGALIQMPGSCPEVIYLRVRAAVDGLVTPWSNTQRQILPPVDFEACTPPIPSPVLSLDFDSPPDTGTLRWVPLTGMATEVQAATDPAFTNAGPSDIEHGTARSVLEPDDAPSYHRARYVRLGPDDSVTGFGPWSNTVTFPAPLPVITAMRQPARGELNQELLAVQRALLRFCATRGDLVALLSLPAHYRNGEVSSHVAELGSPSMATGSVVAPLHSGETAALSYAAVYHPWTSVRVAGSGLVNVRSVPPDGSAAGSIARRAIERGAWIAPANEPLAGVVALTPAQDDETVASQLDRGINVLHQQPNGFVALGSETLSRDSLLRPLSVRRLMILIRRLALRYGDTYVFEPHGRRLRSMVRRTFEGILADLYQRGAFAGAVPSDAYRVIVDDSVNPPDSRDRGRLVVELWVAPSQPIKFLKVRLLQVGSGALSVVEG